MSVSVDEERQHDAPGQSDLRRVAKVRGAGRDDLRDRALIDKNVDGREAVKIERPRWRSERAAKHARLF